MTKLIGYSRDSTRQATDREQASQSDVGLAPPSVSPINMVR
jgi:hypothetical protein